MSEFVPIQFLPILALSTIIVIYGGIAIWRQRRAARRNSQLRLPFVR
jgi:hypothetical protein